MEVWKEIIGFDKYKVSSKGRVKSTKCNKELFLKDRITKNGYNRVCLYNNGKQHHLSIHRLVAIHFIDNKLNNKEVNHRDLNKLNNCVNNLEWCTRIENITHSYLNGRNKKSRAVIAYNDTEEFLYNSVKEASVINKTSSSSIINCLSGRSKSCAKYKWKYKKE